MQDNKYLKHDASASIGCKWMFLSEKEGLKGDGFYWLLLGTLRKAEGFRALMAVLMVLARRVMVKSLFLRRVVEDYDLFAIEDGRFYSPSLCTRLANDVHKVAKASVKDSSNHLIINESLLLSTREVEVKEKENNNNNNKIAAASAFVLDRGWDNPSPIMRHRAPTHILCGTKRQSCGNDESNGDDTGDENHRSPGLGGRFTEFRVIVHRVWEADSPSFESSFTEFERQIHRVWEADSPGFIQKEPKSFLIGNLRLNIM